MGPIWGQQDPGGPHVGPMNLAIWGTYDKETLSILLALCEGNPLVDFTYCTKNQQCVSVPWRHHVMGKWYEKTRNETVLQCFIQQSIEMVMAWIQCQQTHTHTPIRTIHHALAAGQMSIMSELLFWVGAWSESIISEYQRHLAPPTAVASVLTIQPWAIPRKQFGTSWTASHTGHNSEPIRAGKIQCCRVAYTWHWRIIWRIILYKGDTRTCPRAFAAG